MTRGRAGRIDPACAGALGTILLAVALWLFAFPRPAPAMHDTGPGPSHTAAGNPASRAAATGDLSLIKTAPGTESLEPGRFVRYRIQYRWDGDGPATSVRVSDDLPPDVSFVFAEPPASSQSGSTLTWDLEPIASGTLGEINVYGTVRSDAVPGTTFTNTATISGDVVDGDATNNRSSAGVQVKQPAPQLWLWKFGSFEEFEAGSFLQAEQDVEAAFDLLYFNLGTLTATGVILEDTLPAGTEFVSAQPAPTSVEGNRLTWDIGSLGLYDIGEVKLRVRPTQTGQATNTAVIRASDGVSDTSRFSYNVVPLLPPRVLRPDTETATEEAPLIIGPRTAFRGVAKAGSTVTVYEGRKEACFGDFSTCGAGATPIGSAVAGPDRLWVITPTSPLQTRDYFLYFRAEKDGQASRPFFNFWQPVPVRIDDRFERAGFDLDHFVIDAGPQETRPGGVGGRSGATPNQEFTIKMRQKAPPGVADDPALLANHDLQLVITTSDQTITETVRASEVRRVISPTAMSGQSAPADGMAAQEHFDSWDFIYVHKGFGPGSKVEIWCKPVFYSEDGIPLVGLVYVKCHEIVVDPAGYVYDREKAGRDIPWPQKPDDEYLIPNATVTATLRTGDGTFARWPAEDFGQVNPQVTDISPGDRIVENGYFAFYVPPGQYKVLATAPGCTPYESPILTVVEEPIFHNVPLRCAQSSAGQGAAYRTFVPMVTRGP